MKNVFDIFNTAKNNPLFNGVDYDNFEKIYNCLSMINVSYKKDEIILISGDKINFIGLILSGSVKIIKEDANGNASIIAELFASETFGEVFVCAEFLYSPVTVQSSEECEVMFIDYKKIIRMCSATCVFHSKIIENMLKIIAKKNLLLSQKIEILSKRTTREKLLLFFDTQRGIAKKFTIPYNRQELADYLCVDRSAMSNELCKMRDEGLIKFKRNDFELISSVISP